MSANTTLVHAPPAEVFRALAEPAHFAYWVLGSKDIRGADPDWPEVGSVFHHALGVGPLRIEDHTEVIECDPPRRMTLRAHARPLGTAIVRLLLEPDDGKTRVIMEEHGESGPTTLLPDVVLHWWTGLRNVGSLRRLKRIVERPEELELEGHARPATLRAGVPRAALIAAGAVAATAALTVFAVRRRRRGAPRSSAEENA